MRLLFFILVMLSAIITKAQSQKGYSIYKTFKIHGNKFVLDYFADSIRYCPSNFKNTKNNETIFKIATERYEIGHIKPEPFIAFSCKWNPINVEAMELSIRFSTPSNKNDNDINDEKIFEAIIPDGHYDGNDGYKVSQLMYIDKKYTHFEIVAIAKNRKSTNILNNLKLNFFNPYGVDLLNDKRVICSYPMINFSLKAKLGEFFNYDIKVDSLPNFNWENQLKLNYDDVNNELAIQNRIFEQNINVNKVTNSSITTNTDNVTSTENTQACPCSQPSFITRTQWNCPQGQGLVSGVGTSSNVSHLIVHHSAGANTATDWNAVVLSVWNYHTGTNGWSDVGYNWLVAPNGQLYEGRGSNSQTQNVTGAHFCGTNANTMGVCMLGTYTSVDITAAARGTLAKILAWKACQQNIPVTGTAFHASSGLTLNRISGHRDGCATDCPGTTFYNTLPTLRLAVQDTINACGTPPPPCMPSLQNSFTGCPSNTLLFAPANVQNGGTAPVYAWYVDNVFVQNGALFTLANAVNGNKVFARMTSNATCISATQQPINSDTITVSCIITTPVINIDGLQYCRISPNPNNGKFVVQMQLNNSKTVQYKLTNLQGQTIFTTKAERVQGIITKQFSNNLPASTYILEISYDGKRVPYKIVVN